MAKSRKIKDLLCGICNQPFKVGDVFWSDIDDNDFHLECKTDTALMRPAFPIFTIIHAEGELEECKLCGKNFVKSKGKCPCEEFYCYEHTSDPWMWPPYGYKAEGADYQYTCQECNKTRPKWGKWKPNPEKIP